MFVFSKENGVGGSNYTKVHLNWCSYVNINHIYTTLISQNKNVSISLWVGAVGVASELMNLFASLMTFFNYG